MCMYGLARAADYTRPTLRRHVRQPLEAIGGTDLFMHVLLQQSITNPRNKEDGVELDPGDFLKHGPACRYTAEDQDSVDTSLKSTFDLFPVGGRFYPARYDFGPPQLVNYFRALYSLQAVARMAMTYEVNRGFRYRVVAAVRPDTAFLNELPVWQLQSLLTSPAARVVVPNFHHWWGVNDRAAVGTRDAMFDVHMNRSAELHTFLSAQPLQERARRFQNSETFLCKYLVAQKIEVEVLAHVCIVRVRSDGHCSETEFKASAEAPTCMGKLYNQRDGVPTQGHGPCKRRSCKADLIPRRRLNYPHTHTLTQIRGFSEKRTKMREKENKERRGSAKHRPSTASSLDSTAIWAAHP